MVFNSETKQKDKFLVSCTSVVSFVWVELIILFVFTLLNIFFLCRFCLIFRGEILYKYIHIFSLLLLAFGHGVTQTSVKHVTHHWDSTCMPCSI